MLILSSSFKRFIIIAILLLSVILGIRFSEIGKTETVVKEIDTKEAERVFHESYHARKTIMNFAVSNFPAAVSLFEKIISDEGIKKFYHIKGSYNIVSVIEIPEEKYENTIALFKDLPGLQSERTETLEDLSQVTIDTAGHIEQNRYLLQRYRDRLNNPYLTTREISEIQIQIRDIQTSIDSLYRLERIKTQQQKQNHLVLAVIRKSDQPRASNSLMKYVDFALYSFVSFIIITIVMSILYVGIIALDKLFGFLGVKSPHKSSHYLYRYQGYGRRSNSSGQSGYVKRKRKYHSDEEPQETEQQEPEKEEKT